MTDSTGKSRAASPSGGALLRAGRSAARKADLEKHLRNAVASGALGSLGLSGLYDPEEQKLHDAIREVAIPAIDQLKRDEAARRNSPFTPPPLELPRTSSTKDVLLKTGPSLSLLNPPTTASPKQSDVFRHSSDYCSVDYGGRRYLLTKQAADIVKALHEAHQQEKIGCSGRELRKIAQCGKVWDAFRRRDGRAFYENLIEKVQRDIYALNLKELIPAQTDHDR